MKSFIINIKNLIPYFLLIVIYFFFVNLEARKNQYKYQENYNNINEDRDIMETDSIQDSNTELRIKIPIIPYKN
tara:strand:+ start:202 stop:423 length:222 start_codon:yes stop_codon:yes gene_type:complete